MEIGTEGRVERGRESGDRVGGKGGRRRERGREGGREGGRRVEGGTKANVLYLHTILPYMFLLKLLCLPGEFLSKTNKQTHISIGIFIVCVCVCVCVLCVKHKCAHRRKSNSNITERLNLY